MAVDVTRTRVAAIQLASGPIVDANLQATREQLETAARSGARLVVLPENFACMPMADEDRLEVAEAAGDGPIQAFLAQEARRLGVWIVGGTVPIRIEGDRRAAAACLVYDADGSQAARYDKIYLFDVVVPDVEERYQESACTTPGETPVVVDTPAGCLGLAVCYDLRFPEHFRQLLDMGAETIVLPAAFTAATGRAHWELLVRARAVENLCYVVAAAQGGFHANGRETWGDSMVVDFWGQVLARQPRGPGVVQAEIDLGRQRETRHRFPVLAHRR